jgi:hypothetical protein
VRFLSLCKAALSLQLIFVHMPRANASWAFTHQLLRKVSLMMDHPSTQPSSQQSLMMENYYDNTDIPVQENPAASYMADTPVSNNGRRMGKAAQCA